ncbi:MAG: hypothetical protein R2827_02930 [Bdellovibrionales bacterium]
MRTFGQYYFVMNVTNQLILYYGTDDFISHTNRRALKNLIPPTLIHELLAAGDGANPHGWVLPPGALPIVTGHQLKPSVAIT